MKFAVVDGGDNVLRFGKCGDGDLEAQAGDGEVAVEVSSLPVIQGRPFKLIDGELVEQ